MHTRRLIRTVFLFTFLLSNELPLANMYFFKEKLSLTLQINNLVVADHFDLE